MRLRRRKQRTITIEIRADARAFHAALSRASLQVSYLRLAQTARWAKRELDRLGAFDWYDSSPFAFFDAPLTKGMAEIAALEPYRGAA
jgi:hypothetical protein